MKHIRQVKQRKQNITSNLCQSIPTMAAIINPSVAIRKRATYFSNIVAGSIKKDMRISLFLILSKMPEA